MAAYAGPQRLGLLIDPVIDDLGLRDKLEETKMIEAWAIVAGPQINRFIESVWVRDCKLHVKLNSSVWRQELHLQRRQWCARVNEHLAHSSVKEIIFR